MPQMQRLGQVTEVALDKIVPDRSKSVKRGAIVPLGSLQELVGLQANRSGPWRPSDMTWNTPMEEMDDAVLVALLNGLDEPLKVSSTIGLSDRKVQFEGIIPFILEQAEEGPKSAQKWAASFTHMVTCPECNGSRLEEDRNALPLGWTRTSTSWPSMSIADLHAFMSGLGRAAG